MGGPKFTGAFWVIFHKRLTAARSLYVKSARKVQKVLPQKSFKAEKHPSA
jgi:hypothetical protein